MSLHKLSAGHGYDYLIRQVAALDATHRGRTDLASYYTERGEAPGQWVGRGLAGVDGLDVGDV
ncbi:MAG: relaxase domain-containing protein, partial [Chloroflexota bacterium]